jgi:hypothetical protein
MSGVHITKTTALYPNGVFVQWDIDSDEVGPFLVDVARSASPEGPWEIVTTAMLNAYSYLDKFEVPTGVSRTHVNQFSLAKMVYYRVTVVPPSGVAATFVSEPTPVEPHLDRRTRLLKRKIQRDQAVGYKRLNGIPLVVLKRRRWGDRCGVCYDPITKQATHEHCPTCYGTSFVGGYWAPVAIRGRREAASVQAQMASHGDAEMKIADFNVLDYPLIEYKDLIIDLVRNDRYQVQRCHETELKSVPVHQKVTASLLARNSVEYSLLVDPLTTPSLY